MNFPITRWLLLLMGLTLLAAEGASAQNRNAIGASQQNQRSAFGIGNSESPFGSLGQASQSQGRLGSSAAGQLGQSGNQGRQGANFGQPPVGGQDGFVGSDSQQIRNNRDPRQSRRAMFDFAIDSLNDMRESRRQERASQNEKPPVRVRLRPLFTVVTPTAAQLATQVRTRVDSALPAALAATTRISVSGNTATINGTVSTEYDRRLASKILSLQPGIMQIENQLVIDPFGQE